MGEEMRETKMSSLPPWSVTMTTTPNSTKRYWGARIEWIGMGFWSAIQVNKKAPSVRIITFGWALYFGRILPKPKTIVYSSAEITAGKHWTDTKAKGVRDAKNSN